MVSLPGKLERTKNKETDIKTNETKIETIWFS